MSTASILSPTIIINQYWDESISNASSSLSRKMDAIDYPPGTPYLVKTIFLGPDQFLHNLTTINVISDLSSERCHIVGTVAPAFYTNDPDRCAADICNRAGWALRHDNHTRPILHLSTFDSNHPRLIRHFNTQRQLIDILHDVINCKSSNSILNAVCDEIPSSNLKFIRVVCPDRLGNYDEFSSFNDGPIHSDEIFEHAKPGTIVETSGRFTVRKLYDNYVFLFEIDALQCLTPTDLPETHPVPWSISEAFNNLRWNIIPAGRRTRTLESDI